MGRFVLSLLTLCGLAVAGGSTGGGNVVICGAKNSPPATYEVLDYYEARTLEPKLKIFLGDKDLPIADKVRLVLNRLARLDETRATRFQGKADAFMDNAVFLNQKVLPSQNDYGYVPLNPGCSIQQLAIQHNSGIPEEALYTVRQEYWNALSNDDRAGLILHEVIYGEAMARGQKDSINTRLLNTLISSSTFEAMSAADYQDRLKKIGFSDDGNDGPPLWVMNPVKLPGATIDSAYTASLSAFVHDPQGSPLSLSLVSCPALARVSADGTLSGTPAKTNMGVNEFVVRATNAGGLASDVTVDITVFEVDPGPQWAIGKIDLGTMSEDLYWSLDLTKFLIGSADRVKFSATNLPAWMSLDSNTGILSGTPRRDDVGMFADRRLMATKGEKGSSVLAFGTVVPTIHAPKWTANPLVMPNAGEAVTYNQSLVSSVLNYENAELKFTLVSGPAWLQISGEKGILFGTPGLADVGPVQATVMVSSTIQGVDTSDQTVVTFTVEHKNHPPYWTADPVELKSGVGEPFNISLNTFAADPDGDRLTFTLQTTSPAWLSLSPDGTLSGTPADADIGVSNFTVAATDSSGMQSIVNVHVTVSGNRRR